MGDPKITIAVIDDEDAIRSSVRLHLLAHNYEVIEASNGEDGLDLIRRQRPDLIVLDVLMPKKDGLQTTRDLRQEGISTPLILLTSRSTSVDKVLGLELGADDYLAKPFEITELLARIKAILRRAQSFTTIDKVQFANVAVDFKAYKAERDSMPLELSAREYRLLRYLVAKKGNVVTRNELLDEVWGYNSYPSTRTVDNHIARLRQKIEENHESPRHILTVHGVGYKFVA